MKAYPPLKRIRPTDPLTAVFRNVLLEKSVCNLGQLAGFIRMVPSQFPIRMRFFFTERGKQPHVFSVDSDAFVILPGE